MNVDELNEDDIDLGEHIDETAEGEEGAELGRVAELEAELLIAGRAAIPNLPVVRSATTITRWEPGQLRPY